MVVAPAMHSQMWQREAVQQHAATLAGRGVVFAGPVEGPLASGESGPGRLADVAEIVATLERVLGRGELAGRRVLVSAGPTWEPIDPVRFLGNRSSGKMGFALAAEAARRGASTVLVAGPVALPKPPGVERIDVETAHQMRDAIYAHAPGADLVIMTAAVADFRPAAPSASKLKKERGVPAIAFATNPDILAGLPDVAPDAVRVGFAAETERSTAEAEAKFERQVENETLFGQARVRVAARPRGSGNLVKLAVVMPEQVPGAPKIPEPPRAILDAALEGATEAMRSGPEGYPFEDIEVLVTGIEYRPDASTPAGQKAAVGEALRAASREAGTRLLEPIMKVEVTAPESNVGDVLGDLNARHAHIEDVNVRGNQRLIIAKVPLRRMFGYSTDLRSATQGRANYTMQFESFDAWT